MSASITTITGTVCKVDGTPVVGSHIRATVKSTIDDQGGQVSSDTGVTSDQAEAFTDESGNFSIDLIAESVVLFEIPDINLRKEILIPISTPVNFVSII